MLHAIHYKIFEMKTRCKSFLEHDSKSFYGSMNVESCVEHIKLLHCQISNFIYNVNQENSVFVSKMFFQLNETVLRWRKVTLFCFIVYIVNCNIKTKTRKQ